MRAAIRPVHAACILTPALLLAAAGDAGANKAPAGLAEIKKVYKEVTGGITAKRFKRRRITVKAIIPGTGEQERELTLWARKDKTPARVSVSYNVAARTGYKDTFTFDQAGKLVFLLSQAAGFNHKACERIADELFSLTRCYLKAGKLVRIINSARAKKRSLLASHPDCAKAVKKRQVNDKPKKSWRKIAKQLEKRAAAFRHLLANWSSLKKSKKRRLLKKSEGMRPSDYR